MRRFLYLVTKKCRIYAACGVSQTPTTTLQKVRRKYMADKKLYYDKIYGLVMQCRKSGLSDKQWCINNAIAPSTFYWWIKKLRQQACYEIPEHSFKCNTNIVTEKQDVVCVNVLPEAAENITLFAEENDAQMAHIMFKYKNASITLQDDFNEYTLKRLLTVLQEVSC